MQLIMMDRSEFFSPCFRRDGYIVLADDDVFNDSFADDDSNSSWPVDLFPNRAARLQSGNVSAPCVDVHSQLADVEGGNMLHCTKISAPLHQNLCSIAPKPLFAVRFKRTSLFDMLTIQQHCIVK